MFCSLVSFSFKLESQEQTQFSKQDNGQRISVYLLSTRGISEGHVTTMSLPQFEASSFRVPVLSRVPRVRLTSLLGTYCLFCKGEGTRALPSSSALFPGSSKVPCAFIQSFHRSLDPVSTFRKCILPLSADAVFFFDHRQWPSPGLISISDVVSFSGIVST